MNRKLTSKVKLIYITYIAAWIATAIAVIFAIKLTGSAWCLWAFYFPGSININIKDEE